MKTVVVVVVVVVVVRVQQVTEAEVEVEVGRGKGWRLHGGAERVVCERHAVRVALGRHHEAPERLAHGPLDLHGAAEAEGGVVAVARARLAAARLVGADLSRGVRGPWRRSAAAREAFGGQRQGARWGRAAEKPPAKNEEGRHPVRASQLWHRSRQCQKQRSSGHHGKVSSETYAEAAPSCSADLTKVEAKTPPSTSAWARSARSCAEAGTKPEGVSTSQSTREPATLGRFEPRSGRASSCRCSSSSASFLLSPRAWERCTAPRSSLSISTSKPST